MKLKKWIKITVVVAVSSYLLVAAVLVWSGLNDDLQAADVALVLGNQVDSNGVPSPRLAARLDRAVDLYGDGLFGRVIVSGGTGKEGYPEGDAMRDYLIAAGIPGDVIIVDNQGFNTAASAVNTASILSATHLKSVFVISQHFHIPRCKLALRQEGVTSLSSAHAEYFEWRDFYSAFREVPAYAKYALLR